MRIILFFAAFLAAFGLEAQGIKFFSGSWQEALDKAKAENRYIFVDAYATWCGPCKKMSSYTFKDEEVGNYFNRNFINVKLNMEDQGDGTAVAEQFSVSSYPTFLFIGPDGELAYRSVGYQEPDDFLDLGKTVIEEAPKMAQYAKKYESGDRSLDFLYTYATALQKMEDPKSAEVAEAYLEKQTNWSNPKAIELIVANFAKIDHPAFEYAHQHSDDFIEEIGEESYNEFVSDAVVEKSIELYQEEDKLPEKTCKALYMKYMKKDGEKKFYTFCMNLYEYVEEWENYARSAKTYVEKFSADMDASTYNNLAWKFYVNVDAKADLEKALEWVLTSIKLEKGYSNMDTAASLYYKLGNKGKAKKYAQEAIRLGKAQGEDVSMTEELLEKINQM